MAGIDLSQADPKVGGGVEGMGLGEVQRATQGMEMGAYSESEREMYNAHVRSQNKLGIEKLASMAGTVAGSAFGGPLGGALGGMAAGTIAGAL